MQDAAHIKPLTSLRFFAASEDGVVETSRIEHAPPPLLDEHASAVREWLDG